MTRARESVFRGTRFGAFVARRPLVGMIISEISLAYHVR